MATLYYLFTIVLALDCYCKVSCAEVPVVSTRYGKIQGFYADSAAIFLGIPFASPPTGFLRWKAPIDAKSWGSDIYLANSTKPACPQYDCETLSPSYVCPNETSEDCLYLNIYTPQGSAPAEGWPVMIYIHGGNFLHMDISSPLFDARHFAASKDIIQVNINYRLGALGFLVTGKTSIDATGNYGIMDQQLAMKWVTENIANFGGDTSRITLYGQSAGAQSTLLHVTLPDSAPYFQQTIIESTPITIPYKRFPEAILLGSIFAGVLDCMPSDLGCLQGKTADQLAEASVKARSKVSSLKLLEFFEPWGPYVDGNMIKGEPLKMIQSGQFNKSKPMIIGSTSEETVLYIFSGFNHTVNNLEYAEVVTATYPLHGLKILDTYPPSYPADERNEMVKMSTDLVFTCSTRNGTRTMIKEGAENIWMYVWNHAFSFPGWGPVTFCEGRVCHGSEIVYLYHSIDNYVFKFTPAEEALSQQIMDYWSNFAKYGNPNGDGNSTDVQPDWPNYTESADWPAFKFQTPTSVVDTNYHGPYCDFWDRIGYSA